MTATRPCAQTSCLVFIEQRDLNAYKANYGFHTNYNRDRRASGKLKAKNGVGLQDFLEIRNPHFAGCIGLDVSMHTLFRLITICGLH